MTKSCKNDQNVSKIAKKSKFFKKWYGGKIRVKMVGSKFWEKCKGAHLSGMGVIESGRGSSEVVGRVKIWGKW